MYGYVLFMFLKASYKVLEASLVKGVTHFEVVPWTGLYPERGDLDFFCLFILSG